MEVGTPRGGTTGSRGLKPWPKIQHFQYTSAAVLSTDGSIGGSAGNGRGGAFALRFEIIEENVIGLTAPTDPYGLIIESRALVIQFGSFGKARHQTEMRRAFRAGGSNRDSRSAARENIGPLKR